jgi:hypothetical protein
LQVRQSDPDGDLVPYPARETTVREQVMRHFHILSAERTNGVVVPTSPLESITGPYTVLKNEPCVELALGGGQTFQMEASSGVGRNSLN